MKQVSFLPALKISTTLAYRGEVQKGKRKIARPFDPRRPLHVVFRSTRARGEWSLLRPRHRHSVERTLDSTAEACGIRIHRFVNVGNHLHLLLSAPNRMAIRSFLRRFAGEVAMRVTGASKLNAIGRFWDALVYTRVVSWGREFDTVMRYLVKNVFEATGLWNRKKQSAELRWYRGG